MDDILYSKQADDSAFFSMVSFFAALCLFLAAVEYAVPKPFPFMRLGLANLPILLSLTKLPKRHVLLLIIFKVLGQALISGTLFSYVFVFSAAGSAASGLTMLLLYSVFQRTGNVSNIGLSVSGAFANNCAQVAVARVMVFGENTKYIAPVLFATGLATGLTLGIFANTFCARSEWYKNLPSGGNTQENMLHRLRSSCAVPASPVSSIMSRVQFIIAMILFPVFLLQKNVVIVWGGTVIFYILTMFKRGGKVKLLPSLFMTLGVTFFALLTPYGKVLFSFGSFRITQDALVTGLRKSGILAGMVFLSQFAVSPRLNLPGRIGRFLGSVFAVFNGFTAQRIEFRRGHVIEALDSRLLELWG
ncbi:MAG: Gx transporter family protein [Treponema sp.]|nr:Gx transporter family protein [Treponema sp.]